MRRGAKLQWAAENLELVKAGDRDKAARIAEGDIRALHKLPKRYVRARLLQALGLLDMLDGSTYSNDDRRVIAIKALAVQYAKEISYWLRLQIKESQSGVDITNKLLRKLGLTAEAIARPGARDEVRNRVYQIADLDNPVRQALLKALRDKHSPTVSTTRIGVTQSPNTSRGHSAKSPPNMDRGVSTGDATASPPQQWRAGQRVKVRNVWGQWETGVIDHLFGDDEVYIARDNGLVGMYRLDEIAQAA